MKKVFIGFDNTAGLATRLKEGFAQISVKADFYTFTPHPYCYKNDIIISYSPYRLIRIFQKLRFLALFLLKYDYFIYISNGSSFFKKFLELKIYKWFGKKTMVIFTGCDIRMPEKVLQLEWNTCRDCTNEYKEFVGCVIDRKKDNLEKSEKLFDIIFSPDECAGYLTRSYHNTFFPINPENYRPSLNENFTLNKKVRILHAPSNPIYKGTPFIIKVIDKLKEKYDFEFVTVRNVSIEELYDEIKKSDLIIDSVIGGFYGLFSVEAMALGKPVVGFIRKELPVWKDIKDVCPIFNANPDNLYEVLENILQNPVQLADAGRKSRKYIEDYHDAKKIAAQYYEIFENTK